jgi:hypothetical protein
MFKKVMLYFTFFFVSTMSCSEKKVELPKTECEQIKDIVTDCMGLHRGALDYIKSCGDISLEEINLINTCDEILNYIENKD